MELDPQTKLLNLTIGNWLAQMVYVAAKLGIADELAGGPKSAAELATRTGSDPEALYRLLRGLASIGVFVEEGSSQFALTPMAELLQEHHPDSKRAWVIMMGEEHYRAYGDLIYSVQTGKPAFEKMYGQGVFEYLPENPEAAKTFDAAMQSIHGRETGEMLDAFDFGSFSTLADIGGGNGSMLSAILHRYPKLRGILFDMPGVIARSKEHLPRLGIADRCETAAGSFFEEVPAGADAYILRHIIHDWDDARARKILETCRQAMPSHAKLLLVESVIPAGNGPSFGKLLDIAMLALVGGKERTEDEYRELLASAGLKLERIVPTRGEMSVLVAGHR